MSKAVDQGRSTASARLCALTAAFFALLGLVAPTALAQHGSESENMRLVGHHDLDGRSAYQPLTKLNPVNDQWYTYVGHHAGQAENSLTGEVEPNGTSIVRVTNPRRPRLVAHIPATGPGQSQAQMVRICNGEDLPRPADRQKVYMLRSNGNVSHEIWDVTRPRRAELVSTPVSGLSGTHKSWWDCKSGIGYLVGGAPRWRTDRMTQVFDLSNPKRPMHIRDFGLPGQEPGSTVSPVPEEVHGGIQLGNRFYNGHGTSANGVMQILDVQKLLMRPFEPTVANLLAPQVSRVNLPRYMGAHTTFPVLGIPVKNDEDSYWDTRDIVVISNESTANECREAHQQVFLVDVTDELNPFGISNYKVDEKEGDFCQRGGRFGAHSSNENMTDRYYRKIVFIAYFNAGIRAVDIRDPFNPREVGKYIPATTENTDERCVDNDNDGEQDDDCKIAIQTNNLETDDREYVYAVDRANTGLHIVTVTGDAREIMRSRVEPNAADDTPSFDELEGE